MIFPTFKYISFYNVQFPFFPFCAKTSHFPSHNKHRCLLSCDQVVFCFFPVSKGVENADKLSVTYQTLCETC